MKYIAPYDAVDPNASYSNGNAVAGIPGSIVDARAIEHTQREIVEVITQAGLTPDEENLGQLYAAIAALIAGASMPLDTDGTMAANSDAVAASQKATRTYIATALAALVDSSPSTLDTLNELAAALGDDPNFATTVATALGLKAPVASPGFTGNPTAPTQSVGDNSTKLATTAFVQTALAAINKMTIANYEIPTATAGSSTSTGAWTTVPLNNAVINEIAGATVSSNRLNLPAGTYELRSFLHMMTGSTTGIFGGIRLRDVTNSVTLGSIAHYVAYFSMAPGVLERKVTFAAPVSLELQYYSSNANIYLGPYQVPPNTGEPTLISQISAKKVV